MVGKLLKMNVSVAIPALLLGIGLHAYQAQSVVTVADLRLLAARIAQAKSVFTDSEA